MRTIVVWGCAVGLALVAGVGSLLGCEALEPEWSETRQVSSSSPWAQATCDDVCDLQGSVCLERSCSADAFSELTIVMTSPDATEIEAYVQAECSEPFEYALFTDPGEPWVAWVSCCCAAGY
jgi:hypothetical protein